MGDPYRILNIDSSCSDEELKQAYRNLLKQYSTDLSAPSPQCEVAQQKIDELNDAYDAIMNMRRGSGNRGTSTFSDIRRMINQNRISEADELLEGVPQASRDAEWYFLKGSVLHSRGWIDRAMNCFSRAVNMEPNNAEYRAALNNMAYQRNTGYNQNGGYRQPQTAGGCSGCDMCSGLLCADCCCECMGGDLIACC